jgi:hypothetical protein
MLSTAGVSGKGDAFNSPGQASDIATEVVTNLAQWRLSVDPDQGTVYSSAVVQCRVESRGDGSPDAIARGVFADAPGVVCRSHVLHQAS